MWNKGLCNIFLGNMEVNLVKVIFMFCADCELVVVIVVEGSGGHIFMGCPF